MHTYVGNLMQYRPVRSVWYYAHVRACTSMSEAGTTVYSSVQVCQTFNQGSTRKKIVIIVMGR